MGLSTVSDAFLAARVRAGDDAAFAELARRYSPLVSKATRRPPRGMEREDLRQEALMALRQACMAHRPRVAPFAAYAKRGVSWRIARACETAQRHKHRVLSDAVHDGAGELERVIAGLPASPSSDPAWIVELLDELRGRAQEAQARRTRGYSREQIERAVGMVGEGRTLKEITLAIGAPNTTVLRWAKRAGVTRTAGRRRFTAEEIEHALTLHEQGATLREAGSVVGASAEAVMGWKRGSGRRGGARRRAFTKIEIREALALVASGASARQAAAAVGASEHTVRRWQREAA